MARLFYHKPRYAILDECTSGVTIDMEQRFCERVKVSSPSIRMPSHRRCSLLPADANQWSLFRSLCSLSSHHSPCFNACQALVSGEGANACCGQQTCNEGGS